MTDETGIAETASAKDRDRREDGRPEQARPRDRTGRPLPYGTTGVPLAEDHAVDSVEEALALGVRLWDEGRLFESHECLEEVWHAAPESDRDLWQGVIQVAVAGVHCQRGNPSGAIAVLERAQERLSGYPAEHRGVDVEALRTVCAQNAAALRAGAAAEEVRVPAFPAVGDGPWFGAEPSLPSTGVGSNGLAGLEPGVRYRCAACGNVTRFDVVAIVRTRRYHHFDLGGAGQVDEEEILDQEVESVTCRWCGRDDSVDVEPAPAGGPPR